MIDFIPASASSVFQVSSLDAALDYYKSALGFSEDFRFGSYAGVKLGPVSIHLTEHIQAPERSDFDRPVGGGAVYIFCNEVDAYFARIKQQGAILKSQPADSPYGLRDFFVADPDGNQLGFGRPIA